MKRNIWLFILPFVALVLQSTIFNKITIYDTKPDLLIIIMVFFILLYGDISGAKIGFLYGLLEDLITGKFIGINCLSKMITGYAVGFFEGKLYRDNILVPVIFSALATVINNIVFFMIGILTGFIGVLSVKKYIIITVITVIYNSLLAPLLYVIFYKFTKSYNKK
jgi:rod shape-determining protein MreD